MSGYPKSAWVRALPPTHTAQPVVAPTVMRLLTDAGLPPSPERRVLDAHCGTGSAAKLAALIGYTVHANDLDPACALSARHALSGRTITPADLDAALADHPSHAQPDPWLSSFPDMLMDQHFDLANRLAHAARRTTDSQLTDALRALLWRYVIAQLPGGTLVPSRFTAMVRAESWDAIPTSADTALRAVLTPPRDLLTKHLNALNGGAAALPRPATVTDLDAPACIAAHPADAVILSPPSPGDSRYALNHARVSRLLTGEEASLVESGMRAEDVEKARAHALACLDAAKDAPCVVWVQVDRHAGQFVSPLTMRQDMERIAPLRPVRIESYESARSLNRIHLAGWC